MENHIAASGRKRGTTRHSVEDQALDQIAKEEMHSPLYSPDKSPYRTPLRSNLGGNSYTFTYFDPKPSFPVALTNSSNRIVGLGSGKPSKEDEEIDRLSIKSRSESPADDTYNNNFESGEEIAEESVKKGVQKTKKSKIKRNHKPKKDDRKGDAPVIEKENAKVESDEGDDHSEITSKHHIPDQFYEDLSETDKSNGGASTSRDVSSSDLSENSPEKACSKEDNDDSFKSNSPSRDLDLSVAKNVASEIVPEDSPGEKANFDEFWKEFDEEEGKIRKLSQPDELSSYRTEAIEKTKSEESPDFWADEQVDSKLIGGVKPLDDSECLSNEETNKSEENPDFWTKQLSETPKAGTITNDDGSKLLPDSIQTDTQSEESPDFWADQESNNHLRRKAEEVETNSREEGLRRKTNDDDEPSLYSNGIEDQRDLLDQEPTIRRRRRSDQRDSNEISSKSREEESTEGESNNRRRRRARVNEYEQQDSFDEGNQHSSNRRRRRNRTNEDDEHSSEAKKEDDGASENRRRRRSKTIEEKKPSSELIVMGAEDENLEELSEKEKMATEVVSEKLLEKADVEDQSNSSKSEENSDNASRKENDAINLKEEYSRSVDAESNDEFWGNVDDDDYRREKTDNNVKSKDDSKTFDCWDDRDNDSGTDTKNSEEVEGLSENSKAPPNLEQKEASNIIFWGDQLEENEVNPSVKKDSEDDTLRDDNYDNNDMKLPRKMWKEEDNDDFWGDLNEEDQLGENRENFSVKKDSLDEISKDDNCNDNEAKLPRMMWKEEDNDDFWGAIDDSESKNDHWLDQSNESNKNENSNEDSEQNKTKSCDDDHLPIKESSEKEEVDNKHQDVDETVETQTEVDEFWGGNDDDLPPVYLLKNSKDVSEELGISNKDEETNAGEDSDEIKTKSKEKLPCEESTGNSEEEVQNHHQAAASEEVQTKVDDFWGNNDEDVLPPVYGFKKSIDVTETQPQETIKEENEPIHEEKCTEESESNSTEDTASEESSEDATQTIEPSKAPEPVPVPIKYENPKEIKDVHRKLFAGALRDIAGATANETQQKVIPRPPDITEVPTKEDVAKEGKEVHKKNFANALRDIETPHRRRSVLLPDNRERILREERQSRHSESSAEGEASEDDGIMDFLGKENDRAEARLAARRQARVEAREIRMRELERVQREQQEEGVDRVFDLHGTPRTSMVSPRERPTPTNSYHSSRRSSEDSMEDGLNLRDIRHELKEVEDKFRKAMIANAQLDNEKAALSYQVELLKDKLEDLEEAHSQLGREHRERCREHEALKRATIKLKEDLNICKQCLDERDRLIEDYGLVIVGGDIDEKGEIVPRTLVSTQSAEILETAGEGSLDVRLKTLGKEKNELLDEVRHLKLELEEERNRRRNDKMMSNGPIGEEIQQTLNDYRFRLQKAEQETSTLQATVARLESQVIRYKTAAEVSEKAETELKTEKRKLQREHRESISRIEELETANFHLQRRMDKLKNAKSTLLKEL